MSEGASETEIGSVAGRLEACGYSVRVAPRGSGTVIGALGRGTTRTEAHNFRLMPGVETVDESAPPYLLTSRQMRPDSTVVEVRGVPVGGGGFVVIAGPCAVETREQLIETAVAAKAAGADMLRGGAFKPRTSPYDFQGLGVEGLELLAEARRVTGLPVVTEVMDTADVELVAEHADVLQVGARNMQNYALLRRLAAAPRPVLLKRSPCGTVREWLLAAEYLLSAGNPRIILCERGIKTFETETRNTLDLAAVALVKELSHLPVIADPSHATGSRSLVPPMSRAALAAGADGLMIEIHPRPERALCDGTQALDLEEFSSLMRSLTAPRVEILQARST